MIEIEIRHRPVFFMAMNLSTAKLLQRLAYMHYDGRCQASGKPGGFIYGWINGLEFGGAKVGPIEPNEFDTTCKIMEIANSPGLVSADEMMDLVDLRRSIGVAMREAKVWS